MTLVRRPTQPLGTFPRSAPRGPPLSECCFRWERHFSLGRDGDPPGHRQLVRISTVFSERLGVLC